MILDAFSNDNPAVEETETIRAEKYLKQSFGLNIGPNKPMGYIIMDEERIFTMLDAVIKILEARGNQAIVLKPSEGHSLFPTLFAWNDVSVQRLLDENAGVLSAAGWPQTSEEFVKRVANQFVPSPSKLFDLIADAFGDKTNPGRTQFCSSRPKSTEVKVVESVNLQGEERRFADFIRRRKTLARTLPDNLDEQVKAGALTNAERIRKTREFLAEMSNEYNAFLSIDEDRREGIVVGVIRDMKALD